MKNLHTLIKEELNNILNKESFNPTDKVKIDIPLFIRLLEYAREDAKSDMDLHNVAERAIELSVSSRTLTMDDYNTLVNGQMNEDTDIGHTDDEPDMLKADVYRISEYAGDLYKMLDGLDKMSEEVDLPDWWQQKIHLAADYIDTAKHYLEFELKQPEMDSMMEVKQDKEGLKYALATNIAKYGKPQTPKGAKPKHLSPSEMKKREKVVKKLKKSPNLEETLVNAVLEKLKGKQTKLDANKDGKISKEDFELLRKSK
jgi:hypothetical protein